MKITFVSVDKLTPHPDNPRHISRESLENLAQSIKEDELYFEARPVICSDRTGQLVIIAGNQRFKAAKLLGMTQVPTITLKDLTEKDEKRIMLKDNGSFGKWEVDLLRQIAEGLEQATLGIDELLKKETDQYEKELAKYNDENCQYPIVPKFGEKYNAFIIICDNVVDETFIRNSLGMETCKSYKSQATGKTNVITSKQFIEKWGSRS